MCGTDLRSQILVGFVQTRLAHYHYFIRKASFLEWKLDTDIMQDKSGQQLVGKFGTVQGFCKQLHHTTFLRSSLVIYCDCKQVT